MYLEINTSFKLVVQFTSEIACVDTSVEATESVVGTVDICLADAPTVGSSLRAAVDRWQSSDVGAVAGGDGH
jgi:hypothetical protein